VKPISRTVWVLSFVSLFADMASEMLYPIVPVYLKEIGFSILLIGILEGVAEFTAGFTKGYFGKQSDEKGLRLPYVKSGYFLSALSKPMMAVFTWPLWIFSARTMDRLGKGLRTAARDALLSQQATPQTKARVFSFHRGMDTLGAVAGPLIALVYLYYFPHQYATLFYLAFIPGLVSVGLIFLLKEQRQPVSTLGKGHFFSYLRYWKIAQPTYKRLVAGLLVFALFNSSDVFLLLKTKAITGSDTTTIAAYIFYNLVYAAAAYPMGILADKMGMRKVFAAGLLVFGVVYFLFAYTSSTYGIFAAFLLYGIYAAATEGIAKAWISNLAHQENTATALGFYSSAQSIMAFLASSLTGLVWVTAGDQIPFLITGAGSLFLFIYFCFGSFRS
jgi:MFS family permease